MPPDPFAWVPDSGTLKVLESGLILFRRMKHEWNDSLDTLSREELSRATDKISGSKFSSKWPLARQVEWIPQQLQGVQWQRGTARVERIPLEEEVGLVLGKPVRTICIRSDGHYVHAYPDKDA